MANSIYFFFHRIDVCYQNNVGEKNKKESKQNEE